MEEKFFLVQIQRKNEAWTKGVVVHNSLDEARQGYHAYLGAYAYGHDKTIDYVQAEVIDMSGCIRDSCIWKAITHPEPPEEE